MGRTPGTNGVQESGYEDLIRRLLEDRWPTTRVSDYIARHYHVELTPDQVRHYRDRIMDKTKIRPPNYIETRLEKIVTEVDIMEERAKLIKYQIDRLNRDGIIEQNMQKNLGGQAREIDLLNKLLNDHKNDLQMFGRLPPSPPSPDAPRTSNTNITHVSGLRLGDGEELKDSKDVRSALRTLGENWQATGQ